MKPKIELLAPGGDVDAIKAAIIAGANAVYCGLDTFNARNRAANLSFEQLLGVIRLAHEYQCQIFLTLNIVILEREFSALNKLLNQLANTTLDGVIVQDIGLLYVLQKYFPTLDVHASTQLTTHNIGQVPFLKKLGVSRVNLSRELSLKEITQMANAGQQHDVLTEVFVHGSLCVAFSGLCYSTSASVGNSGNRGRCSQACREEYQTTESGNNFPLNIKDNSAFFDLPALIQAGVHSFKVEGRIKGASYVHTVIDSFRKQIDGYLATGQLTEDGERLYQVFNRDFTNAFLRGDLNQSMFSENARDNSRNHAVKASNAISVVQIHEVEQHYDRQKQQMANSVFEKINHLSIAKPQLSLVFSGQAGQALTIAVKLSKANHTSVLMPNASEQHFTVHSSVLLRHTDTAALSYSDIHKRFKSLDGAAFSLVELDCQQLAANLSLPFKALSQLKNDLLTILNEGQKTIAQRVLPPLLHHAKAAPKQANTRANLSILISDPADVALADISDADIYFKLPDAYKRGCSKYIEFLRKHPRLIPWFPSVLIGKDYAVALDILEQVKPNLIVTNNTGIAHRAYELGISWIAGPFLNTTNSYALLAMQEQLNCSGAFISNEINNMQIRNIARPQNFKLLYSIYHPILLMASRQCFFQQSVGCEKPRIDNGCMLSCDKSTSITNLKGESFAIDKQKAGYPSIYNQDQFLNTQIIDDLSHLFDDFMIDLTNIGLGDKQRPDKAQLIQQFEQVLLNQATKGEQEQAKVKQTLKSIVPQSTNLQYHNGL